MAKINSDAIVAAKMAVDYAASWLEYRQWRLRIPGVQVAVWLGGESVLQKSFGIADSATNERLTNTHQFRIASHSKWITATAILRLVDDGQLRLDDSVAQYVPALATTPMADVSVRELLSHASGMIRDSADTTFWSLERDFPDSAGLDEILSNPLDVYVPNSAFKYTNIGFGVLGRVIEAVTGKSYDEAMRDLVIRPLGLTRTVPDVDDRKSAKPVTGHSGFFVELARHPLPATSAGALTPATGFTSTANELARFAWAHVTGNTELLSDRAKRLMRQTLWQTEGRGGDTSGYGLGTMVTQIAGRSWYGHAGGWPGQATRTLVEPELGIVITVLTNAIDAPAEELAAGVAELLLASQRRDVQDLQLRSGFQAPMDGSAALAPVRTARRVELAQFTGRFQSLWSLVDVVQLGECLYAIPPTAASPMAAASKLVVVDDSTLRIDEGTGYASNGEPIRYEWDARGRVKSISGGWRLKPASHVEAFPLL